RRGGGVQRSLACSLSIQHGTTRLPLRRDRDLDESLTDQTSRYSGGSGLPPFPLSPLPWNCTKATASAVAAATIPPMRPPVRTRSSCSERTSSTTLVGNATRSPSQRTLGRLSCPTRSTASVRLSVVAVITT